MFRKFKAFFNTNCGIFLYIFLMIFLMVSPFDRLFPFSMKRIVLVLFLFVFFLRFLFKNYNNITYYFLFLFLVFVFINSSFSSESKGHFFENFEDFMYFSCLLICILMAIDKELISNFKNTLIKYKKITILIIFFCYTSFGLSLFFDGSFLPGTSRGFRGFMLHSHSAASLFTLVIALLIASHVRLPFFYVPALLIIYFTKARTFLVLIVPLIYAYFFLIIRNKKIAFWLFTSITFLTILVVFVSPIGAIIFRTNNGWSRYNPIDAFSSNRSIIWANSLRYFLIKDSYFIIFGEGFSFIRNLNENLKDINARIWAHNDFIQTLLGTGLFGLGVLLSFIISFIKQHDIKKGICIFLFIIISSFLNGLMEYFNLSFALILLSTFDFFVTSTNEIIQKNKYEVSI